jgi:hypothetical protein
VGNKYLVRRTVVGAAMVAIAALGSGCHLLGRSELRNKQTALTNSVAQRQATLASLQGTLSTETAGLEEYVAAVRGYMVEHKGIVAALVAMGAGGSIALDKTNRFSDDAKQVAATVGGVGLLYCVFNMNECASVLSELDKADAHRKTLEAQIASTQSAMGRESSALLNDQNNLQAVRRELGD